MNEKKIIDEIQDEAGDTDALHDFGPPMCGPDGAFIEKR